MIKNNKLLFLLISVYVSSLRGEIYTWKDNQGKTHFSDQGPIESKILKIKPGYSFHKVKYVVDGDTVVLENGEKIRLLGVNTPEVARRDKLPEVGGEASKKWLQQQLTGTKVRMQKDLTDRDKYGRTLAHLFTVQGTHLNLALLERGLAMINIYPPDLLYTKQLLVAQQRAEKNMLGIWHKPEYEAKDVQLTNLKNLQGWQRLRGEIKHIRSSRKYVYLEFSDEFSARINKQNLPLFPKLQKYLGRQIEIRGWVRRKKNLFSMLLRHPSAIKVLN